MPDVSPENIISAGTFQEKQLSPVDIKERQRLMDQSHFLSIAKQALSHAVDSRRRYDYEWMVRDLFRRGYQFSRYQPTTQTIILASRQTARIPINLTAAQLRSIKNQTTSFRPKFEILPRNTTEESRTQARYSGRLLDYYYDKLNLKKKIKETVMQGLTFSVGGPWQIIYDEDKKEVAIWLLDPFDFYFDPLAEDLEDAEFVIKTARRPLTEVIYNPEYNKVARKEVTGGEAKLSVSEYKQFMLQALKYVTQYSREENPTVILYEGYFRVRDDKTGEPHLRKLIWTDQNQVPLVYEDLDTNEYDFVIYQADINPKEILGESWIKHVMVVNRVINSLESSVFDYNYRVAKGRIIVDKDSGVRAIHNVHGEIISKVRGSEVRAMDMPALPVATSSQIERMWRYMEDIGAVHDASLGRQPPGSRSGVQLAELKQADSTGQQDLVDNLEDFLTNVAFKLLKKIAQNYSTIKVIHDLGYKDQEAKYFAVVGNKAKLKGKTDEAHKGQVKIGPDWLDLAVIGEENNIRVTIGSWLGYTKEMMQEKVLKLLQLGAIDQKTFLELWEFGDVAKIVEQTRKEQLLKGAMNKPQGDVKQVDPYVENTMMVLEGKDMPVDMHDDHLVHIIAHQDVLGRGADELVGKHIELHQMYYSPNQQDVTQQEPQMPGQQLAGNQQPGGQQAVNPADAQRQQQIQGMQGLPSNPPEAMNDQTLQRPSPQG